MTKQARKVIVDVMLMTNSLVDNNVPYAQVPSTSLRTGLEEHWTRGGTHPNPSQEGTTRYTYGDALIAQTSSGVSQFYQYDGLGSTRSLTDATGAVTDAYTYDAYGQLLEQTGASANPYLYRGEQYDLETDAYYLRARYYQPGVGRFLTTDPVEGFFTDPLTRHRYLYGNADPISHTDPTGRTSLLEKCFTFGVVMNLASMALGQFDAMESVYENWGGNLLPDAGLVGASVFAYVDFIDLGQILQGWYITELCNQLGVDPSGYARALPMHHFRAGGIVGIELLFSFGSGELAPLVYVGGQAEYSYAREDGKTSPFGADLSVYNGWVWNLWNAVDYSGFFQAFSFGRTKSGFSIAYDAEDGASKGPYSLTIPVGSIALGEQYERTNYLSIGGSYGFSRFTAGKPIHYSYGMLAGFYAATQLAIMTYSSQNFNNDGGIGLTTSTIGFSMTYTIMKSKEVWNRNQPRDAEGRDMLERRRTQGRPGVNGLPGEWQSGPGRWIF